jgi:hypothetical protein
MTTKRQQQATLCAATTALRAYSILKVLALVRCKQHNTERGRKVDILDRF